jgi:hypothetical protein
MSIDTTLQRVAEINLVLANPVGLTGGTAAPTAASEGVAGSASAGAGTPFAQALQSASAGYGASGADPSGTMPPAVGGLGVPGAGVPTSPSGSAGSRLLAAAETQIGQSEQPPGSNESPAIAEYRGATAGAIPGAPWCAYFASWAARQAGEPLGAQGQGLGSVSEIWSWAQSSGRAVANGPGVVPRPGDLIVFGGEHVGIVRGVLPDGSIQTVEGNYENKVSLNVRPAGEASGYVSMG